MSWWCKKKSEKKMINIGVTDIKLTFLDGTDFIVKIYGNYSDYWGTNNSYNAAKNWFNNLNSYRENDKPQFWVDDSKNPKITVLNTPIKKEILETKDYFEEYMVEVK